MKQETRGGSRPGAGRHKQEPTKMVRIPVSIEPQVNELKRKAKKRWKAPK